MKETLSRSVRDPRVLAWDIMNGPDNDNAGPYRTSELAGKAAFAYRLPATAFGWACEVGPDQPLMAGVWHNDWATDAALGAFEKLQLSTSAVLSFHSYELAPAVSRQIESLRRFDRPLLCTGYMARSKGSTFATVLPVLEAAVVGAFNWGFVAGCRQTTYPWDSWKQSFTAEPSPWFHDIFRPDGTPHDLEEADLIRELT